MRWALLSLTSAIVAFPRMRIEIKMSNEKTRASLVADTRVSEDDDWLNSSRTDPRGVMGTRDNQRYDDSTET
jgi:hypothetical protein